MRDTALLTTLLLLTSSAAVAAPTISLTWTSTSGGGTTGSSWIGAWPGDTLRLLISVHGDGNGLLFAGVSLAWDAGDLIDSNAVECPAPENAWSGFCTDGGAPYPPSFIPHVAGVTVGPGTASSFDAAGTVTPIATMHLGSIEFVVANGATIEVVSVVFTPGIDGVVDGQSDVFFPAASASVLFIPEPGSAALLGLGLTGIGIARRRHALPPRSSAFA